MRFAITLMLLFSSSAFAVGGVVNKGGDTVRCQFSAMGQSGYYTLDYALAIGRGARSGDFVRVPNWTAAEARMMRILSAVDKDLADSFGEFAESLDRKDEPGQKQAGEDGDDRTQVKGWTRKWISHRGRPFEVEDIGDISDLPIECKFGYKPGPHAKFKIYRMIQRSAYEARRLLIYRYDKSKLHLIRGPLQKSFLMVHEWLWDLTEDVEVNRQVNAFLHSVRVETMPPAEIAAELRRLGL